MLGSKLAVVLGLLIIIQCAETGKHYKSKRRFYKPARKPYKKKVEDPWPVNQKELVELIKSKRFLTSDRVEKVMLNVDRGKYIAHYPYLDAPRHCGYGTTFTAPHVHALALEHLKKYIKPGSNVLDIGCGNGYFTVCLALMVGENGTVTGIDHINELVYYAQKNVEYDKPELLKKQLKFVVADGRFGYAPNSPYDAIHVGASVTEVPEQMAQQLKPGGRMVLPIGLAGDPQKMALVDKDIYGGVTKEDVYKFEMSYCEDLLGKDDQFYLSPGDKEIRDSILLRNITFISSSEETRLKAATINTSRRITSDEMGFDLIDPEELAPPPKTKDYKKYRKKKH